MAKKSPSRAPKKAKRPAAKKAHQPSTRKKVKRAILQAREPLSLLQTLRDEGMANAQLLLTLATGAARSIRPDAVLAQLTEVMSSLGFATREDLDRLEGRIAELEQKLSEREFERLKNREEE